MNKKLMAISLILACVFAFSIFASCSNAPIANISSEVANSEDAQGDANIKENSSRGDGALKDNSSESSSRRQQTISRPVSSAGKTSSFAGFVDTNVYGESSEDEGTTSYSSGIKQYKNPKNLGLFACHLSLFWCNSYGTDYESRLREFTEVVESGYFNQYLLSSTVPNNSSKSNMDNVITEAKLIAKAGGSFWLFVGYNPEKETLKQYEEKLRGILDQLERAGCRDILNGIHWDEPYYNNYTPEDLQDQMRINYNVFGLRNFAVFGLPEFSEVEPRTTRNGKPMPQISAEYSKYLTDAAFDYYTIDVREGRPNGGAYDFYSGILGVNIKTGKDVYIAYKNKLKKDIGHPVSLWHFSCAYAMPTWASETADEDYCMENLRFLVNDVVNDSNPGGVALYTYYTHSQSHNRTALQERIPIKDKNGNYTRFPKTEKWESYFKLVKTYSDIFSSIKHKRVNIGI